MLFWAPRQLRKKVSISEETPKLFEFSQQQEQQQELKHTLVHGAGLRCAGKHQAQSRAQLLPGKGIVIPGGDLAPSPTPAWRFYHPHTPQRAMPLAESFQSSNFPTHNVKSFLKHLQPILQLIKPRFALFGHLLYNFKIFFCLKLQGFFSKSCVSFNCKQVNCSSGLPPAPASKDKQFSNTKV